MNSLHAQSPISAFFILGALVPWFCLVFSPPARATAGPSAAATEILPVQKIIITTQGGSGHLQAAERIKQDLDAASKGYIFIDVIKDKYMHSLINIGKFGVNRWNSASKKGRIKAMNRLSSHQWLAEIWYGKHFYKQIFKLLTAYPEIDEVIDTQPFNTEQVLKAVYRYNEIAHDPKENAHYNKHLKPSGKEGDASDASLYVPLRAPGTGLVTYRKVLTDLPTDEAQHFLGSIKRIKGEHAKYFTLETPPYPGDDKEGQKTRAYFYKLAKQLYTYPDHNPIKITYGPIRHGFLKYIPLAASKEEALPIKVSHAEEYQGILEALNGEPANFPLLANQFELTVGAAAQVHSIMLGSQVSERNTLAYIQAEMTLYEEMPVPRPAVYLFVFTGANKDKESIFNKVLNLIREKRRAGNMPDGLNLVPLSSQGDEMIGRLYSMADRIIIRSGGLSAMEVEAVSRGEVFIHSAYEKEEQDLSLKLVTCGMPSWEWGNALHVLSSLRYADGSRRAFIVNPSLYLRVNRSPSKGQAHGGVGLSPAGLAGLPSTNAGLPSAK